MSRHRAAAGGLPDYAETTGLEPDDAAVLWLAEAQLAVDRAEARALDVELTGDQLAADDAAADVFRATLRRSHARLEVRAFRRHLAENASTAS